jgi:hypothetical protein
LISGGDLGAELRQLDINNIGQFALGMISDPDRAIRPQPFVGPSVLEIVRNIHGFKAEG